MGNPAKVLNWRDFSNGSAHLSEAISFVSQGINNQFLETHGSYILSGWKDEVVNVDTLVTNIFGWAACTCSHVLQTCHSFITKYILNNYFISGATFDA